MADFTKQWLEQLGRPRVALAWPRYPDWRPARREECGWQAGSVSARRRSEDMARLADRSQWRLGRMGIFGRSPGGDLKWCTVRGEQWRRPDRSVRHRLRRRHLSYMADRARQWLEPLGATAGAIAWSAILWFRRNCQ